MKTLDEIDDALLALSAKVSADVRKMTGIDQWTQARLLMRTFAVAVCMGHGTNYVQHGFDAMGMVILTSWAWVYHAAMNGIDRSAKTKDGSARLRVSEHQYRRLYSPMLSVIALMTLMHPEAMQIMIAIGFVAMVAASYVKACEPPPPDVTGSRMAMA